MSFPKLELDNKTWTLDPSEDKEFSTLDGLPCPDKDAINDGHLSLEAIEKIDAFIKEMVEWKKAIFGITSQKAKFPYTLTFSNEIDTDVIEITGDSYEMDKERAFFPERVRSWENYIIEYREKLREVISD